MKRSAIRGNLFRAAKLIPGCAALHPDYGSCTSFTAVDCTAISRGGISALRYWVARFLGDDGQFCCGAVLEINLQDLARIGPELYIAT
jgi:hypothetical protein